MQSAIVQVVGPGDHWVLERLARRLAQKLPYATFCQWKPRTDGHAKLAFYVNYALYQGPSGLIDVGYFTHRDDNHRFLECARQLDFAICMSKIYADWLRAQGVKTVACVPAGFDLYRFRPRLVLGVVGLLDHPRKGRHLVERVKSLPFVDVRVTQGKIDESQLWEFYQALDYVLIPATIEGGPLCLLEGLGMGKPVIAPTGIGMVPEFPVSDAILRYPTGDGDSLVRLLEQCFRQKCRGHELVRDRTWDHWAAGHHRLFRQLLLERGEPFPEPDKAFRFGLMSELTIPADADTSRLEETVDRAAAHLYFGRYAHARAVLTEATHIFPCVGALLQNIPPA